MKEDGMLFNDLPEEDGMIRLRADSKFMTELDAYTKGVKASGSETNRSRVIRQAVREFIKAHSVARTAEKDLNPEQPALPSPERSNGHPKEADDLAVRTTITLNPTVNKWARELMVKNAHNGFSDFLADLIRREKERDDAHELERRKAYLRSLKLKGQSYEGTAS